MLTPTRSARFACLFLASTLSACNCKGGGGTGGLKASNGVLHTISSLDFGTVGTGTTHTKSFPLKNVGNGPLNLTAFNVQGDSSFHCASAAQVVDPGQVITVSVTFDPTADGTKAGTLAILNDSDTPEVDVALTGVAFSFSLTATPGALDFGDIQVGTSSAAQTVTVTNTSTVAEDIQVGVSGTNAGDFTVTPSGVQSQVAPGSVITLSVTFNPTQPQAETGSLDLSPCSGCAVSSVALTGTGTTTTLILSPAYTNFGTVPAGAMVSGVVTATATALPSGVASPLPITLTANPTFQLGTAGFGVTLPSPYPATLAAGQSFQVTVTYTGDGSASASDTLQFPYTVGTVVASPALEPVSAGQVGSPCSGVTANPASVFFGSVQANATVTKNVTMNNAGMQTCVLSMIGIDPNDTQNDYSTSASAQITLTPGQSQAVAVSFAPTNSNPPLSRTATLGFSTSDTFLPRITVPLSATVGNSAYSPSAWPKFHRDNANSGLSTSDTSNNTGAAVSGFPVLIGPPVPPSKYPTDLASMIFSPVVGLDSSGNDVVYVLGYGPGTGNVGTFWAIGGANGASMGQVLGQQSVTQPESLAQECTPTVVADNSVYLLTGGEQGGTVKQFYHFAPTAASIVWSDTTSNASVFMPAVVDGFDTSPGLAADGTLYLFNDDDPGVYAFTPNATGAPTQKYSGVGFSGGHMESYSAALTDDDHSVFSSDGYIQLFDQMGSKIWDNSAAVYPGMIAGLVSHTGKCGNDSKASPALVTNAAGTLDAVAAFGGYDSATCTQAVGGVQAFNVATGALDWTFAFPTIASPPSQWVISYQK